MREMDGSPEANALELVVTATFAGCETMTPVGSTEMFPVRINRPGNPVGYIVWDDGRIMVSDPAQEDETDPECIDVAEAARRLKVVQ